MIISIIFGTIYGAAQQVLRLTANDPQIQMAQDAAASLNAGNTPTSLVPSKVDSKVSLAPFIEVYDKCSGMLHSENPYAEKKDLHKIRDEFSIWFKKIVTLLNHHNMELVGGETMLIGQMLGREGLPEVHLFQLMKGEDGNPIQA